MSIDSNVTPGDPSEQYSVLQQQIQHSLQKAEGQKNRLKAIDKRCSIINLLLGVVATFIAGESAIAGEPIVGNWRFTTTIASVCTLGATITAGVHKQLASPDLLLESSECVAKLKALKVETISPSSELGVVSKAYQKILSDFSRIDC
ncbi:MAG: hypothetical protein WA919_16955 [Coleofasciculaceae cyanobacterium]